MPGQGSPDGSLGRHAAASMFLFLLSLPLRVRAEQGCLSGAKTRSHLWSKVDRYAIRGAQAPGDSVGGPLDGLTWHPIVIPCNQI